MQRVSTRAARAARRRRATALVEAAILLPFLTLVFAGVVFWLQRT